jgi:META domain
MPCLRRHFSCWLSLALLVALRPPALAAETSFPFGSELILDVSPMHGSKRIPMIEIDDDGATSIDLWCSSFKAQARVGEGTISIAPQPAPPVNCSPERQDGDVALLAALEQVTNWRRSGDLIEFTGATTLRFHLMTN